MDRYKSMLEKVNIADLQGVAESSKRFRLK